jgi:hypothetical protein
LLAPAKYREHVIKFPRSMLWGRVLMGIAAAIAWWVMYHAATDEWKWAQPFILVGVPVAYFLVINFAPNYLAMRGTAALMLMASTVSRPAAASAKPPQSRMIAMSTEPASSAGESRRAD